MFRHLLNHKIGTMIALLAGEIKHLSMTKLLKLLYLIDETAYARTGASITWFDYKVWKMGPVAEELYNELRFAQSIAFHGETMNLDAYIRTEKRTTVGSGEQIFIYPMIQPDLGIFSTFEPELVQNIIDRFGSYSARQLINILHEQDTLWHKTVKNHQLDQNFKMYGSKSNHTIGFAELIQHDPILQKAAQSAYESMQSQAVMRAYAS
jgi:uncharacterized phage-associated protein